MPLVRLLFDAFDYIVKCSFASYSLVHRTMITFAKLKSYETVSFTPPPRKKGGCQSRAFSRLIFSRLAVCQRCRNQPSPLLAAMFLRFLNFSPRVMPILTANCFIIFMKITQIQPCILWKTTPVANPLHKPARTLKHSQTPQCPCFIRAPPLPIHLPTFPSSSNPTPISRQHHVNTAPAPHPLTIEPNPAKSQVMGKRVHP